MVFDYEQDAFGQNKAKAEYKVRFVEGAGTKSPWRPLANPRNTRLN
jgi:hypothetical protein